MAINAVQSDLLQLTQWLSPSFPVSSYAYSHGLEVAMADGSVANGVDLSNWIAGILRAGSGRNDAILLCHARRATLPLAELGELAEALASSAERLEETRAQGAAFVRTVNIMTARNQPALPYPVAIGAAARDLALDDATIVQLFLHAFASNLVSVGVRFIPLGQTEGQHILSGLHAVIAEVSAEAISADLDDLGGAVFAADLAAMQHETLDVRLFRT
ncbi:MAG: urease accessory protein [Paracoccaceae bacterium]|jgi:urease accessory protein